MAQAVDVDFGYTETEGVDVPGDPAPILRIPEDHRFEGAYMPSDNIGHLAEWLIGHREALNGCRDVTISYLWKRKGGTVNGRVVYGKCSKTSPLVSTFDGGSDFTIWLAANHCREYGFQPNHLEALLFHELLHVGAAVDDDTGDVSFLVNPHDFEMFEDEVREYGLWTSELKRAGDVFQSRLPGMESVVPFGGRA